MSKKATKKPAKKSSKKKSGGGLEAAKAKLPKTDEKPSIAMILFFVLCLRGFRSLDSTFF